MAEQTFSVGDQPRVVITIVSDDVRVRVSDERSIVLESRHDARNVYQEGDTLTISQCDGPLDLRVPSDTSLSISHINGDVSVEGVRDLEVTGIGGDVELEDIDGAITLADLGADLAITRAASVRVRGGVGADATVRHVATVELETVGADLTVQEATSVVVGNIGGDFRAEKIESVVHCGTVGGDCQVDGTQATEVMVGTVGGTLTVEEAARVHAGSIGGDADLNNVRGDCEIGNVGGDCELNQVGGRVQVSNISGDGSFRAIEGGVESGNIGGDLSLQTAFAPESRTRIHVGGDAEIVLPSNPNLSIRANVGGDVRGAGVASASSGSLLDVTYGDGGARLELSVGGDLDLSGDGQPSGGNTRFGGFGIDFGRDMDDFGREMNDLGREMAQLGKDLGSEIASALRETGWKQGVNWADDLTRTIEERANRARQRVEEQSRRIAEKAERAQRRAEEQARRDSEAGRNQPNRVRVRINEREWQLDPERLERIKEQARRAAAEGLSGALAAVERAITNMRLPQPPMPPASPATPATPASPAAPAAPVPPAPPATPVAATGQTIKIERADASDDQAEPSEATAAPGIAEPTGDPEQERMAILQMIAEGRVTPEEGDMLLESLGG